MLDRSEGGTSNHQCLASFTWLSISPFAFRRASQGADCGSRIDLDLPQRIGLVLCIHGLLRAVFSNQETCSDSRFENSNAFLEDRSPLEIMAEGDMISAIRILQTHRANSLRRSYGWGLSIISRSE
ncbi:hypothetical protein [Pseudomonas viridiflava]|uniref:hypothetical protein n=1 Tax=Pseudomonas viridiflava TaxID=33069 RepID=UPI001F11C566|nr:hypothetical protein [Pseudomonas viridiflava]